MKCREQPARQRGPLARLTKRDVLMMEESFRGEYRLSLLDHRPDEYRSAARRYGATATTTGQAERLPGVDRVEAVSNG
jgi:hypothetical protein